VDTPFGELPDHYRQHGSMAEQFDFLRGRLDRRTFLRGAAIAGLAVASPELWVQPARATGRLAVSRHVGFGADPRRQAVVSFAANGPFRQGRVEYGPDERLGGVLPVDARGVRGVDTRYGHALLEDLAPGTEYQYRVRLDGVVTETGTLRTAPARPEPFTFTAFGDQGVSSSARAVVAQLTRIRPAFHLLAGDLCYASKGTGNHDRHFAPEVWDAWLAMIEPVAARSAWMCATGNHEMEAGYGSQGYGGYLSRFLLPSNGAAGCPSTYGFRYGNVGFLCLDSNDASYEIPHNLGYSGGQQTRWLAQELAALRAPGSGVDFVVVFFHHCAFSTNSVHGSDGGLRAQWVPLFDRYEVDLVINGHAHNYERTTQIRGGNVTGTASRSSSVDSARGTTYITAGGGGRRGRDKFVHNGGFVVQEGRRHEPEPAPWSLPTKTRAHAFLVVDVTPRGHDGHPPAMAVRAINEHGETVDQVTLRRGIRR
jgi:Calcineurin-like phosphoesterase